VNPLEWEDTAHGRRLQALKPVPSKQKDRARAVAAQRGGGSHAREAAELDGNLQRRLSLPLEVKQKLDTVKDEAVEKVKSVGDEILERLQQATEAARLAFNPSLTDPTTLKLNKLNSETSQPDAQPLNEYYKFRNLSGGYGHFADRYAAFSTPTRPTLFSNPLNPES